MINHRKLSVDEKFEQLKKDLPALAEGNKPLSDGHFCLTITSMDETTVTKIVYVPQKKDDQDVLATKIKRETDIIRELTCHPVADVDLPALISPLKELSHPDYAYVYTMTRVPNTSWPSHGRDPDFGTPEHYESAGRLLAKFHRGTEGLELPGALPHTSMDIQRIPTVDFLNAATNKALSRANAFLQENMRAGNIHGDFHLGNVMGEGTRATGLIDFTYAGSAKNKAREIWAFPEKHQDAFINGYEAESGEDMRALFLASRLALWSNNVPLPAKKKLDEGTVKEYIEKDLDALSELTKQL